MALPHCWNRFDTFYDGSDYRRGYGSYRRRFLVPESLPDEPAGYRYWLDVGGFYGSAQVYLNGNRLGRFEGSYLGFRIEVTDHVLRGENQLGFLVENYARRSRLPGRPDPDFLLYGGLAGHCRLLRTGRSVFPRFGPRVLTEVDDSGARLSIGTHDSPASLRWRLKDETGEELSRGELRQDSECVWSGAPDLWSPESPIRYRLDLELSGDGAGVSHRLSRFVGFRQIRFSGQGFELNGSNYLLHGMNRHESLPGFGSALPDSVHRFDAKQLKKFGCNCVRLSHYPQSPAFLDACDRLGLFVYAEVCSWKTVSAGFWLRSARLQFAEMVRRDRHRPSVLLWGMGNESRSKKAFRVLADNAQRLDPTRPTSYAENHLYRARRKGTVGMADVWGVNYELDVHREASAASRTGSVLFTECMNPCLEEDPLGDVMATDGGAEWPAGRHAKQLAVVERDLAVAAESRAIAGYFAWCYADYATLYRKRYRREAGLFEASRRPRPAARLFRRLHGVAVSESAANPDESAKAGAPHGLALDVVEDLGDALVLEATVCDQDGARVDDFAGDLQLEVEDAEIRCERSDGTAIQDSGAWFWLEAPGRKVGERLPRIVASCAGLKEARLENPEER